ncbi:MAG TPA: hypothetical protein PKY01_18945 [Candidatus Hydrogenedentes bacterium]|nr:hypothetical protein [Candidatus Hydrogenedentota bacterium]HQH54512.1 hypothetical protein [Candidatus Hydrogenedentota bacterium]HQM51483.1 hypothetical protein [Candidatus Hydrogenedentota bacterium]
MKHRPGHPVGAILALLAVAVYSICCKPAWSPKGDQVAYISVQDIEGAGRWAVAIYDLATKQSRVITETRAPDDSTLVPMAVFWPERGHKVAYVSAPRGEVEGSAVQVSRYNLRTGRVKSSKKVAVPEVSIESAAGPVFLEGKRWLWLMGESNAFRVDVTKGKAEPLQRAKVVTKSNGKVFYFGESAKEEIEFGRVKTFPSLKEQPLFTVTPENGKDLTPLTAMPSKCVRFSYVVKSDSSNTLLICDEKGQRLKAILLPEQTELGEPPNAEWTPDGTMLWLTVRGTDSGVEYTGIAEIRVADGHVRIVRIDTNKEHGGLEPLQLSLSPNGTCLAASTATDKTAGLCLVDLTGDARTVTFVPAPATPGPAKTGAAE